MGTVSEIVEKGYIPMSEITKFWYTILVPAFIAVVIPLTTFVVGWGILTEQMNTARADIKELKESNLQVVKDINEMKPGFSRVHALENVLEKYANAVQHLAAEVAANTRELHIRFGGKNAKLFYYQRTCAAGSFQTAWGECAPIDGQPDYRLYEPIEGLDWQADDSQLGETWSGSVGVESPVQPTLFTYESAF